MVSGCWEKCSQQVIVYYSSFWVSPLDSSSPPLSVPFFLSLCSLTALTTAGIVTATATAVAIPAAIPWTMQAPEPPAPALWRMAKTLPAATFPAPDWAAAAADPSSNQQCGETKRMCVNRPAATPEAENPAAGKAALAMPIAMGPATTQLQMAAVSAG